MGADQVAQPYGVHCSQATDFCDRRPLSLSDGPKPDSPSENTQPEPLLDFWDGLSESYDTDEEPQGCS